MTRCVTLSTVEADGRDRDPDRIAQQLAGQLADLGRHGGREEQVLAPGGKLRDDAADRRQEAQIQHLIGLVEDEDLRARQVDIALGDVVEQPAGRGHQDVDAAGQRLGLRPMPDAAEHDGHGEAEIPAVGAEAFGDLGRKLAGGAQHQHAAALAHWRAPIGRQAMDDGQRERGGLAGAGLGDAEEVAPGQRDRDGLRLDGGRRLVAFALQRLQDRRSEAEIGKIHQLLDLSRGRAQSAARTANVQAQRNARSVALRHPACPGLSDGILGALNRRTIGLDALAFVLHAAGAPKSLMERWQLVSCWGAQVKFYILSARN